MDFTLYSRGTGELFTGEQARYYFDDRGLLHVTTGDGNQRTYSTSGWDYIKEVAASGPDFLSV